MALTRREVLTMFVRGGMATFVRGGIILYALNGTETAAFAQTGKRLMELSKFMATTILAPVAAAALGKWVETRYLTPPKKDGSFHDLYQPKLVFAGNYEAQPAAKFPAYLGISQVPIVANQRVLPKVGEYNVPELQHISCMCNDLLWQDNSLARLPIPIGLRREASRDDFWQLETQGMDMRGLRLHYVRDFCNCYKVPMTGYGYEDAAGIAKFQIV